MNAHRTVDLNADVGEGASDDLEMLCLVSSANIACGWHAGDARLMRATVSAALQRGVAIGAHPSYPDREHFGRREMQLRPEDVRADLIYQIGALQAIAHGSAKSFSCRSRSAAICFMAGRPSRPSKSKAIMSLMRFFTRTWSSLSA